MQRHTGNAGILIGFVPLIAFGILAPLAGTVTALGAAAALTLLVGYRDLRRGMILTWANLLLFGLAFTAAGPLQVSGIVPWTGVLVYAVLAAVSFGSILAGLPFTLQYARGMTDPAIWENPHFLRANRLITGIWGGVFTACLLLASLALADPGRYGDAGLFTYIVLAAGNAFTIWYPGHLMRKARSRPMERN